MVMHYEMPQSRGEVFIVRPNNSLKWRHVKVLFHVIAVVMLGIGIVFCAMGAWLVLPFIIAELIVLALVFYLTSLKAYSREVICVDPESVQVQQGRNQPFIQVTLPSARVSLQRDEGRLGKRHLYLQSAESAVEIGVFLVDSERKALAYDLLRALAACSPKS